MKFKGKFDVICEVNVESESRTEYVNYETTEKDMKMFKEIYQGDMDEFEEYITDKMLDIIEERIENQLDNDEIDLNSSYNQKQLNDINCSVEKLDIIEK